MNSLLIYDSDILPDKGLGAFDCILTWQYLSKRSKYEHIEILRFLEENKNEVRNTYLKFIDNISQHNIKGKKLKELLLIKKTFPCWEMSLINEKSIYKCPNSINHVLRIIALEIWIKKNKFEQIYLFTDSLELTNSLFSFCKINGLKFKHKKIKKENNLGFSKKLEQISKSIKNNPILWLVYFCIKRFPIFIDEKRNKINLQNQVLFISYLFNIRKSDQDKPYGVDSFWTPICKKLAKEDKKLNYLSIFVASNFPRNIFQASNFVKIFNRYNFLKSEINLLDSFLSFKIILNSIKFFLRAKSICSNISPSTILKLPSGVNVSHLLAQDWFDSFQGRILIENALFAAMFENICIKLINPKKVFYLLENQGWEYAFVLNFRKIHPNIPVYGFCHSSLRFWDLRYYSLNKLDQNKTIDLSPSKFITNGPQDTKLLIESGLNERKIIELEALRYLDLKQNLPNKTKHNFDLSHRKLKVIVLGDFSERINYRIFDIINDLDIKIKKKIEIHYKPHPVNFTKKLKVEGVYKINSNEKISKLLKNYDLAICGSTTTAALDCYLSGKELVIVLENNSPIMTPVYNLPNVNLILNSNSLKKIISLNRREDWSKLRKTKIFNTDNNLKKWEYFLNDENN